MDRFISYGSKVTQLTVLKTNDDSSIINIGDEAMPKIKIDWESTDGTTEAKSDIFDAVCVANGHYALPSMPHLPGLEENYKGKVMHSIEYDDPAMFAGETVLCIGGRASGADLAREISHFAKHVVLSDSTAEVAETQGKVTWVPRTVAMDENGSVTFDKDCSMQLTDIDTIIFCTGYDYQFPFINDDSNLDLSVTPGERRVMPLFKQLWHADTPTLSFLGLPHSVVPFPMFELQAEAIVKELLLASDASDGSCQSSALLDGKQRREQAQRDAVAGGSKDTGQIKDTHYLGSAQWEYLRDLAEIADVYDGKIERFIATNQVSATRTPFLNGKLFFVAACSLVYWMSVQGFFLHSQWHLL